MGEWAKLFRGEFGSIEHEPGLTIIRQPPPKVSDRYSGPIQLWPAPEISKNPWNVYQHAKSEYTNYEMRLYKKEVAKNWWKMRDAFIEYNLAKQQFDKKEFLIDNDLMKRDMDINEVLLRLWNTYGMGWDLWQLHEMEKEANEAKEIYRNMGDPPEKPEFWDYDKWKQVYEWAIDEMSPWKLPEGQRVIKFKYFSMERKIELKREITEKEAAHTRLSTKRQIVFAYYMLPSGGRRKIPGVFSYAPLYNDKKEENREGKSKKKDKKSTKRGFKSFSAPY